MQADAEDTVDDECLGYGEERGEFLEGGAGFEGIEQGDFAVLEVGDDLAGVVPVVAFACEDEDGVAWSGELADSCGEDMADAADDFEGGSFCGPGALFPIPHLAAGDDGGRHGIEDGPGIEVEQARSWDGASFHFRI